MTAYNVPYGGAANQVDSTFTEQMALNQLDTVSQVRVAYEAETKLSKAGMRVEVEGYGTRFPAYGTLAAQYHTPGTIVYGASDTGNANVRTGNLDDRLIAHVAEDEYDTKQRSSINFRPRRIRAIGMALAKAVETQAAITACLAARAPAIYTGGPTGGQIPAPGGGNSATALNAALWAACTAMDNGSVPKYGRKAAFNPARTNMLISQLLHLSSRNLGNNGKMTGPDIMVPMIANFEIIDTLYLPNTNITSAVTGQRNTYIGDFSQTVGICFQEEAFAELVPMADLPMGGKGNSGITNVEQANSPVQVRTIADERAFAHLNIGSVINGFCVVRGEAAQEIIDTSL